MQVYTDLSALASPAVETPEQAHLRRLEATVARWQRDADYYRQRGMRTQLKRALRTLEQAQRALANADLVQC